MFGLALAFVVAQSLVAPATQRETQRLPPVPFRELFRDRRRFGGARDLEVVAATTQVDDAGVVRVFENSNEHPIAETLGIAAEQLARARRRTSLASPSSSPGARSSTARRTRSNASLRVRRSPVDRRSSAAAALGAASARNSSARPARSSLRRTIAGCGGRLGTVDCRTDARTGRVVTRLALFAIASASAASTASAPRRTLVARDRRFAGRAARSAAARAACSVGRREGPAREIDLELAVLELRDREQPALRGFLAEARELRHAEILLVERAVDLLHDLLEAIGAHDVAVAASCG